MLVRFACVLFYFIQNCATRLTLMFFLLYCFTLQHGSLIIRRQFTYSYTVVIQSWRAASLKLPLWQLLLARRVCVCE